MFKLKRKYNEKMFKLKRKYRKIFSVLKIRKEFLSKMPSTKKETHKMQVKTMINYLCQK